MPKKPEKPDAIDELIAEISAVPLGDWIETPEQCADEIIKLIQTHRPALEAGMRGDRKLRLTLDPGTRDRYISDFDFLPNLTSNQWILFLNFLGAVAEFREAEDENKSD